MFSSLYHSQRDFFDSGATRSISFRKEQLLLLKKAIIAHEQDIESALHQDLRKSDFEAFGTETGMVIKEIDHVVSRLHRWASPERVSTPLMFFPATSRIYRDPLGTVLIIAPWNYPMMLTLSPLVYAIAGGNTAIVKPSEEAPATALVLEKILSSVFAPNFVSTVQGIGAVVIPQLMQEIRFDHVFFTGSTVVGQKIMEMAAQKLVPVTLELGGKSPCIVDASANLDFAAKKITWSKFINAGQTCVAPDYLLVHRSVLDRLLSKITANIREMWGTDPQQSQDLCRIINAKRFAKLVSYISQGKIISGGRHDENDLYIEPTLLADVCPEDSIMQEEIFGPILPVIAYDDRQEVVNWVQRNPFPLSLYVYAEQSEVSDFYIRNLRFGGACINNGLVHLGNPNLPFGGVGPSGSGQYHGRFGFETFTRPKGVLHSRSWFDAPLWYAPFKGKAKWLKRIFSMT